MTDIEYDILDELYFVISYDDLKKESSLSDEELKPNLINLISNGFVKVYVSMDMEAEEQDVNMEASFTEYFYLASKKGLFEHNSR